MLEARIDRRHFIGSTAFVGLVAAAPVWARRTGAQTWDKVQALLDSYVAPGKLPGVTGAIARGTGDAVFLAKGTLAKDSQRAVDADSLFRVYSMTKPITGMAAMMLIEDGKISLDQNIGDFIPGFKNPMVLVDATKDLTARPAIRPITIRNLLTHTAGLGYHIVTKGPLLDAYLKLGIVPAALSLKAVPGVPNPVTAPSLEAFADRLATLPLIADPGTKWSYSIGLDLLGRIIEIASGMPFDRFLQTRLFHPLGMTSSYFEVPASEVPRLTTNYATIPDGFFPVDPGASSVFARKPAFPFGGAGLVMSTRDYDRFLRMLAGYGAIGRTRVMSEATAKLAMSNLMPSTVTAENGFENGQGFGAGGRVKIKADATPAGIGTYGWGGAAQTIAWVDPTNGIRATGMSQYLDQGTPRADLKFPVDFGKAVYSNL